MVFEVETPSPNQILKYWLTVIRYEEAAALRPKAVRFAEDQTRNVNLLSPASDRVYFKISLDIAASLLEGRVAATFPVEGEVVEFFEAWLAKQYRSEKNDEGPEIMVMCPAVHLSSGTLAGLVRFQVSMDFVNDDGSKFQVPSRSNRKRGASLRPPSLVRIEYTKREEGPPFFVDPRLLTLELGILPEELDAVFSAWRDLDLEERPPARYLRDLLSLLGESSRSESAPALLFELQDAVSRRIGIHPGAPKCWPIALVLDASRARPTYHLQRELEMLLRVGVKKSDNEILWSYLTRTPLETSIAPLFGLFADLPITDSQKSAVSHFLGSKLTAVEGPPGTGKTSVILHTAAQRLVERVARFVKTGIMPREITVVCSTNNRAVDNVIDRLGATEGNGNLALGFRTGNRRVCETVSVSLLKQVLAALKDQTGREEENLERLRQAKRDFKELHRNLSRLLKPQIERSKALVDKRRLEEEAASLRKTIGDDDGAALPNLDAVKAALTLLVRLESELFVLSDKCQGHPNAKRRKAAERFYENSIAALLERTKTALKKIGMDTEIFPLPTGKFADNLSALSAWEDAAEDGLDTIDSIGQALAQRRSQIEASAALRTVLNKLAALCIPEEVIIDEDRADGLRHALFDAALEVRSAHAALHAETYVEALKSAVGFLETTASLRRLKAEVQARLRELFPLWGCTLLSMGNVFEDEKGTIDEVIIDEAGQCHPAYAVSVLCRAKRAMVLGDVHQLTPVYGLNEAEERPLLYSAIRGKGDRRLPLRDLTFRTFDKSSASVQETAEASVVRVLRLTDHFRCQKEIIEISKKLCNLDLTVHTSPRSRQDVVPFLTSPVVLTDVRGEAERLGGSRFNPAEIREVSDLLESLLSYGILPEDIAVITPYRAQLLHFRRAFTAKRYPLEESVELLEDGNAGLLPGRASSGIALGTVHRFQGGERSIVLFSTVVTDASQLSFLNERVNLVNVAASRAMDHLVIVGDLQTLEKGRYTKELVG